MIATLRRVFGRHADVCMVLLVVGILTVLFAPIPSGLLDFLIISNFSFALLLLLLTFYVRKPMEFSTFPSLLLVATLFRLSLNVAATRLILSDADAGRVISAIGSYVVGGNYVIGLIVFLILVVVQYVVVTSGAQRVSEVAARFTLDSMPGQQMSIDADLNMGIIDQDEAKRRRKNLEMEIAFYGAMDGASKFVKGDAIAGIVIMLINIVGGLVIGMVQMGMRWDQSLQTYTLLTVGDGIVTQVPALVIAVGTGIIVTRSASDEQLSSAVMRQLASFPKVLLLVMCALIALLFLPGIPVLPVLLVVSVFAIATWFGRNRAGAPEDRSPADAAAEAVGDGDTYATLQIEPVEVHVGAQLAGFLSNDHSLLTDRIGAFRKQFALDIGTVLPRVRFKSQPRLDADAYEICLFGVPTTKGRIRLGETLAINPSGDLKALRGTETREPAYGLPALWIDDDERDKARASGFTLVDADTVFVTHLTETLRQHAAALLTRSDVEQLLLRVRQAHQGLVEEVIPTMLSMGDLQKILQALLREKVSIRNLEAVVEVLADAARSSKDPAQLAEAVRQRLGPSICQSLLGEADSLQVLTLDPALEQVLSKSLRRVETTSNLVVDPTVAEQLLARLTSNAERMVKSNLLPVLLCSPDLRRHVRTLCERVIPHMRILSLSEIPNTISLRSFGVVSIAAQ